jgi:uncharacterized protein DUF4129
MILIAQIGNSAIADTVAAVLRSPAFREHGTVSIGQLIAEWLWSIFTRLAGFVAGHPAVSFVLRIALGAVLLLVVARIIYGLAIHYAPSVVGHRRMDVSRGRDWWKVAQDLASRSDYTGAAHALYLALLTYAARRGLVSLHESKTTGDYLRELRRKPDAIDLPRFTDFTRSYETVIYGIGSCDEDRYTRLNTLAASLLSIFPASSGSRSRLYGNTQGNAS